MSRLYILRCEFEKWVMDIHKRPRGLEGMRGVGGVRGVAGGFFVPAGAKSRDNPLS